MIHSQKIKFLVWTTARFAQVIIIFDVMHSSDLLKSCITITKVINNAIPDR